MELTAFTCRLGEGQGRLAPGVFILGDDEPGRLHELALGDHVELTQAVDLTGVTLVRASLRLRTPAQMASGFAWEAAVIVDGVPYSSIRGRPGRERVLTDLAANVSKLAGPHVVGIRLALVPG